MTTSEGKLLLISVGMMRKLRVIAGSDGQWEEMKENIFNHGARIYFFDSEKKQVAGAKDQQGKRIGVTTSIATNLAGHYRHSERKTKHRIWYVNKDLDDPQPVKLYLGRIHSSPQAHRGKHRQNVKYVLTRPIMSSNNIFKATP